MRPIPILCLVGLTSPAAAADTVVAVDYGVVAIGATDRSPASGSSLGSQLQARLGRRWSALGLVHLTPEVGLGASWDGKSRLVRPFAGARLGFGAGLQLSAFAHGGVRLPGPTNGVGLALDAGAALDLTLLPRIDVGVHGQYVLAAPWAASAGAHLAVHF